MFDRILNCMRSASSALVFLGLVLLLGISGLISLEVLLRKIFVVSIGGADELSGYMFALISAMGFTYATVMRANIRIDVVYHLLPRMVRIGVDLLALLSLLVLAVPLTWAAFQMTVNSFETGKRAITPLATPLFAPHALWTLALALFLAALVSMLLGSLSALIRRDRKRFIEIAGMRSDQEEVDDELARERRLAGPAGREKA